MTQLSQHKPAPGRIEGDVGPVVRNSASNRRALVVAARRDIACMDAVEIPPADAAPAGAVPFQRHATLMGAEPQSQMPPISVQRLHPTHFMRSRLNYGSAD